MSDMTDLVLDFNEIENLEIDVFYDLKSLEWLSMRSNRILRLNDENFIANPKLKWISLDNNLIQKLTQKVFEKNLNLEILSFSKNNLREICIDFIFFESLKFVDFSGNKCVNETLKKKKKREEFYDKIDEKLETCRESLIGVEVKDD